MDANGGLSLVSVNIATLWVESSLYGAMMVLFVLSTYLLVARRMLPGTKTTNGRVMTLLWSFKNPFISSAIVMAMCATGHWLVTLSRVIQAFVVYQNGTAPNAFFSDLGQPSQIVTSALVVAASLTNDMMCIYRVWVIWGYNITVIILPIVTLIGLAVGGIGVTVQFGQFMPTNIFAQRFDRWISCNVYFALGTNLYTTGAILWRIWTLNRQAYRLRLPRITSGLGAVVESSLIYTIWAVFFSTSFRSGSNLQFLAINCIPSMAGLTFMFINARVGLGWAQRSMQLHDMPTPIQPRLAHPVSKPHAFDTADEYGLRPLIIQVDTVIKTDSESL